MENAECKMEKRAHRFSILHSPFSIIFRVLVPSWPRD
jgi:hypothetical protein